MTTSRQTKRARRAQRRARQRRRRQLTITLSVIGALAVVGLLIWNSQFKPPADIVLPESLEAPPNADGKAWGPPDAPVLIEEYSDFQ